MRDCLGHAVPDTVLAGESIELWTNHGPRKLSIYDMPLSEIGEAHGRRYIAEARERGSLAAGMSLKEMAEVERKRRQYIDDSRVYQSQIHAMQFGGEADELPGGDWE